MARPRSVSLRRHGHRAPEPRHRCADHPCVRLAALSWTLWPTALACGCPTSLSHYYPAASSQPCAVTPSFPCLVPRCAVIASATVASHRDAAAIIVLLRYACYIALPLPSLVGCRPHVAMHAAVALPFMALRPHRPRRSGAHARRLAPARGPPSLAARVLPRCG